MILLAIVFCLLLSLIFAVVLVATRPSPRSRPRCRRRIQQIMVEQTGHQEDLAVVLPSYLEQQEVGRFRGIDSMLAKNRMTHGLQRLIVQGQTSTTMATTLLVCGVLAVLGLSVTYWITSFVLLSVACALALGYLPIAALQFKRAQRVASFNSALPDSIEMFARALRVGNSLVASIAIVSEEAIEPVKTEFAEVFKKQNYGLPLRDALLQMLERTPSMDLQVVVTAILVQKDSGGNLSGYSGAHGCGDPRPAAYPA